MAIINSLLDTDLYKLTMQWFILQQYPEVTAKYKFCDRNKNIKFTKETFHILEDEIHQMKNLRLSDEEYEFIKKRIYFIGPLYSQYLSNYRFNPNDIKLKLNSDGSLDLDIEGKWGETVLWEVPLMSLISEIYFKHIDVDWVEDYDQQEKLALEKIISLQKENCFVSDFGTRRRRNFQTQDIIVKTMKEFDNFNGSSNTYLAMRNKVTPIGTQGHEIIMALSELEGLRHANRFMLEKWREVYKSQLGIALTDTYGVDSFLNDFSLESAKTWDGLRHDSGCPFKFIDKAINHYKQLKIDPLSKSLVFSDGLNVNKAIQINKYCAEKIKCAFGIGTFFTNDFLKSNGEISKPLNMVIKLNSVNDIPVVKISENPIKMIGEENAKKVAMWTFFGKNL